MEQAVNVLLQGILLGSLYALYGIGLSLIFGVMRLVNLAHGDLIICAAYLALVLSQGVGLSPFLSLLIVIPVFFGVGMLLQMGLLNLTLGKGPLPPLLITFGLSVILQNLLLLGFTADNKRLDAGGIETASLQLSGNTAVGILPLITLSITVAILFGMQFLFNQTGLGRALRATSDDAGTAEIMGINSRQIYMIAMGISLALVAVAGILLGIRTTFAPADGPARLIFAFETVIIGGLGSLWGSFAGGLMLGVAQSIGAQINPGWFQLTGHLLTLLVLAVRPTGLFARTRDA
jgi:branched-chain amino acid transport system permease protein